MLVNEIFFSIQGESSYSGLPCIFVRLAGCNLNCSWCDTAYARSAEGAREASVEDVLREISRYNCRLVEITGGEPLMQKEAKELAKMLLDRNYTVLIETNGTVSLEGLDGRAVRIVDCKCPSSGHGGSFNMGNLKLLTSRDEIKFVIADRKDYDFAVRFIGENLKGASIPKVLFSPVVPSIDPRELAEWILKDGIAVRLQLQLHKYLWPGERAR